MKGMETDRHLILASTSPRRRELITQFGLPFESISVDVDESAHDNESPQALVTRLARAKVRSGVAIARKGDAIVVAADTVVALDEQILGKPCDPDDASRMLRLLRGRAHVVHSGIAVAQGTREVMQTAQTIVWMRDYSDSEIAAYVATGDPLDKAAAYAIQHSAFHPVARIEGCYANVMGLPLCRVCLGLLQFGIQPPEPQRVFTSYLEADCPKAKEILDSRSEI